MLALLLLQITAPLLLIAWVWLFGSKNLATFCSEVLAVLVVLLTLSFIGVWLVPPWWTPYLLMAFLAVATKRRLTQLTAFDSIFPMKIASWFRLGFFSLLATYFATQLFTAIAGRWPPDETVQLETPLPAGSYLIVSGGNSGVINAHYATLDPTVARFKQWRGQSYALDLVQTNALGFRSFGFLPQDPAAYFIYGADILAPCAGVVSSVVDGVGDNPVPQVNRESMTGNHVVISCQGVEVLLAHMIPGSVLVATGESIAVGHVLGKVGNSGNSNEPHLHIHVQVPAVLDQPFDTNPLPFTVNNRYWLRNQIMRVP